MSKTKKVVVIGAGMGGLAAAAKLAKRGYQVTVLEKNEAAGGRLSQIEENGFKFDIGPSWYMMPEVFADFFAEFGEDINKHLKLVRLDPSYKAFFEQEEIVIPSGLEKTAAVFEKVEAGAGNKLKQYLDLAKYKYDTALKYYVYKTYDSITDFFDRRILTSALKLDLFGSLDKHVNKYFKNDSLRKILKFMVVFIGGAPSNVPALYSLLAHADVGLGIWYPRGGMQELPKAMEKLGKKYGVKFIYNSPVTSVEVEEQTLRKTVVSGKNKYEADIVVVNADYQFADSQLLPAKYRKYKESYWDKKTLSPSALLFYLGVNRKLKNLEHHNLVMDKDWDKHFATIFDNPEWPEDPLYYVNVPSVTDKTVAPKGMENLMILIPIAPGLEDNTEIREKYYNQVISDLEQKTNQEIAAHVIVKKIFGVKDFSSRYNAYKGNAFGLAHTLFQTAIFRPSYKNEKLPGLYYTGQFTVPGVGVPMALISGKIVAEKIIGEKND